MRRRFAAVVLATLAAGGLAPGALAQTTGFSVDEIDTTDYPEVSITVSIENQLLEEVDPEFRIFEEGTPRRVTATATTSDDLKVVLLLDVSGSMRGAPLTAATAAARQFIEEMPGGVQIAIVPFGSDPVLASEFTDDKVALDAALDLLVARGETALYDGIVAASALLASEEEAGRTVILLSDGADTVSDFTLSDAVGSLDGLEVAFYAVELQSPENDREALNALAAATDGLVLPADDPAALAEAFSEIAAELLSSYRITYTSESFNVATINVLALVRDTVIGARTQVLQLPENPDSAIPEPTPSPAEPEPLPDPRPGSFIELSWLQRSTASWLGIGAMFVALATLFTIVALQPRTPRAARKGRSTLNISPEKRTNSKRTALAMIAESATSLATQTLNRGDRLSRVNFALERAGVALRPGEFIVMVVAAVLAAVAVGVLFAGPLMGFGLGLTLVLLVPAWLSSKANKRSALFNEQLGDTLQLMSASLRAGYGLMQAIDAVAEEAPSPTAEEFGRIKVENHLGRDLDDSLKATAARVTSEDFRWVAEAIEIHRQIGGDLAEILDAVNETIRDRNRIRRRIKSLSAEGRISAVILSMIPIVLAILITFINPTYIGELPDTGMGQVLIVFGIIAWLGAVLWMRRIVRLIF